MMDKRYRILVVDDDPNIAKLIRFYLDKTKYEIETVADSRAGIQMIKNGDYDLLLLDMQMPHMDGITFIDSITELPSLDTLIIVITAHDPDDKMISLFEKKTFDYIQKPFTANRLRFTVQNALKHKALQVKYTKLIESVINE